MPQHNQGPPDYILKGVVCFLGAHYLTFIKQVDSKNAPVWKLYDDEKISILPRWCDVIHKILTLQMLPTLLVYEKATSENESFYDAKSLTL